MDWRFAWSKQSAIADVFKCRQVQNRVLYTFSQWTVTVGVKSSYFCDESHRICRVTQERVGSRFFKSHTRVTYRKAVVYIILPLSHGDFLPFRSLSTRLKIFSQLFSENLRPRVHFDLISWAETEKFAEYVALWHAWINLSTSQLRWPTTVTAKELTSQQKEKPHAGKKK